MAGDPVSAPLRIPKRLIVCCDGTWQDGIVSTRRWQYSNILKLSRTLNHEDTRYSPPIPQIVFYQTGIGSEKNFYAEYVQGTTGASLCERVQEAYAFIAHNFQQGDEIFLFGFSRGAYTARMCAALIGEIGVLDRDDMDHFANIFVAFQKRGKTTDPKELEGYSAVLQPFNNPNARGRLRADADLDTFTIKVVGVFDTVGSFGLPEELTLSKKIMKLFGFSDKLLGAHINHAFHAMALNETRADFDIAKFEQTQEGRDRGQILKQVWFAGSHSDVGGGWQSHDLSDISLAWMISNVEEMLSIDVDYLNRIPRPVAPWGTQIPHDPQVGIFEWGHTLQRVVPTKTDNITQEIIHPSVMYQPIKLPQVAANVKENPPLLGTLAPLEERLKSEWPYVAGKHILHGKVADTERASEASEKKILLKMNKDAEGAHYDETWLGTIIRELMD